MLHPWHLAPLNAIAAERIQTFVFPMAFHLFSSQKPSYSAHYKICADGGANRLHDELPTAATQRVPNAIVGDLDSIRGDVRAFFLALGVQAVDLAHDQDSTDLDKCIQRVQVEMQQAETTADVHDLIVVAGVSQ
jgi:thiamine pyrophosphokinase